MGPQSAGLPPAVPADFTALLWPPEKTEASSVSSFQSEMHSLLANNPTEEKNNVQDSQDSPKDTPATTAGLIVPTVVPDNKVPAPPLHFAFAHRGPSTADVLMADATMNAEQALPLGLTLPQAADPLSPNMAASIPAIAAVDPQPSLADVKGIEQDAERKSDDKTSTIPASGGPKIEGPAALQKCPAASSPAQIWKFKGIEQAAKRKTPANWVSGFREGLNKAGDATLKTKTNSGQKIATLTASPGAKEPERAQREPALATFAAEDVSTLAQPPMRSPEPLEPKEVQPNADPKPSFRSQAFGGRLGLDKFVEDAVSNDMPENAPKSERPSLSPQTPDKLTLTSPGHAVEDASAGFALAAPSTQAARRVPEKRVLPSAKRSAASVDTISPNLPVQHEKEPQRAIPLPAHDIPMQMRNDQSASPEKGIPTAMHSSQTLPAGLDEPGIPHTSNPVGTNEAGQDAARKTAPTTLAFGARLDLGSPRNSAVSTTTAVSDPKVSQQNPLPRVPNVPAFAPADEVPSSNSAKPGLVPPRAQAQAQVPQRHTPLPFDATEAPASQSKDQHLATSLRATPAEPSVPQGNAQVQMPLPSVKPSASTANSISANLQLEPRLEPQPLSTNSAHDIRVQIPDDRGGATEVRFLETAGEVRVAVRTADSGLAQTLQSGLHELTSRLTSEGIQTEVWRPGSGTSFQQNGSSHQSLDPNDSGSGGNSSGDRRRDDSQQDKPRWLQEMEASSGSQRP